MHSSALLGLPPAQQVTALAGRPYDLRHAYATLLSTGFNAGVPPKDVARRLGNKRRGALEGVRRCLTGGSRLSYGGSYFSMKGSGACAVQESHGSTL